MVNLNNIYLVKPKAIILLSLALLLLLINCKQDQSLSTVDKNNTKDTTQEKPKVDTIQPGIILTFDDSYLDNWANHASLFDSLGISVTFYISKFHSLSKRKVEKLKMLKQKGHAIGYHTLTHPNYKEYVDSFSQEQYFHNEIDSGLDLMKQAGIHPDHFSIPYGESTDSLDEQLKNKFKTIRDVGAMNNAFIRNINKKNQLFNGVLIDNATDRGYHELNELLEKAKSSNRTLVLIGHRISANSQGWETSVLKIKMIAKVAKELDLPFYTVEEAYQK